jgi:hypothetical protein
VRGDIIGIAQLKHRADRCKPKVVMSPFELLRKGHVRENYYHESCSN